jgi:hypothetical protein
MSQIRTLVLALLLLPLLALADAPPKGFRSLAWGALVAKGMVKVTGPTSDGTSLYSPSAAQAKNLQPILGVPVAEEAYSFSRGRFYSGSAWIDGQSNFDAVKTSLIKAYGQPAFANSGMHVYKWKWPGNKIEIHLSYQAKLQRTTLTYLNDEI